MSPGLVGRCRVGSACVLWRRSGKASSNQWPGDEFLNPDSCAGVAGVAARDASCEMLPLDPHLRAAQCATHCIQR